ncbi:MAG: RNA polymerase sigma factor [Planctomycetota bacterium]
MTDGKPIEWSDLVLIQEAAIRGVMRWTHLPRGEAEDLVVDAMLRLVRSRAVPHKSARALLVTTAVNILRSAREVKAYEPLRILPLAHRVEEGLAIAEEQDLANFEPDPALAMAEEDEKTVHRRKLRTAIEELSPTDRGLITAHYVEGRSLAAIDEASDESAGPAKNRLYRARERLKRIVMESNKERGRSQ